MTPHRGSGLFQTYRAEELEPGMRYVTYVIRELEYEVATRWTAWAWWRFRDWCYGMVFRYVVRPLFEYGLLGSFETDDTIWSVWRTLSLKPPTLKKRIEERHELRVRRNAGYSRSNPGIRFKDLA